MKLPLPALGSMIKSLLQIFMVLAKRETHFSAMSGFV
jgi:hypothetical protein